MLNQSKYCMRKLSCGTRDNISYKQVVDSAHIAPLKGKRDISKIVGTQPAMFVFCTYLNYDFCIYLPPL